MATPCILLLLGFVIFATASPTGTTSRSASSESGVEGNNAFSEHKGYPQLFTAKTSSLLAEALHMLNRVKDVHERRWLEAFIYRLGALAAQLDDGGGRADPSQEADHLKRVLLHVHQQMNEVLPTPVHRHPSDIFHLHQRDDDLEKQLQNQPADPAATHDKAEKHFHEKYAKEKNADFVKEMTKNNIIKEIFSQIQKLRKLGGTQDDIFNILKRTENRIHVYAQKIHDEELKQEEEGAAMGEGDAEEPVEISTLSPSDAQLREATTAIPVAKTTAVTSKVHRGTSGRGEEDSFSEEADEEDEDPSDSKDDLVKQLQDEKMLLVTSIYPQPITHKLTSSKGAIK